jgi:hypothetical protein
MQKKKKKKKSTKICGRLTLRIQNDELHALHSSQKHTKSLKLNMYSLRNYLVHKQTDIHVRIQKGASMESNVL